MTWKAASDVRHRVERALADEGLLGGPRRLGAPGDAEDWALRLRRACERLGPSFALFARYLGSRLDLLPAGDCRELSSVPLAVSRVRRESGLLLVERVLPDASERLAEDLALFPVLASVLARHDVPFDEVMADFESAAQQSLDLAARAAALESLASDAGSGLSVPPVDRERSTKDLLVLSDPGGEVLTASSGAAWARRELARRASVVWLSQALDGRLFTVEPGETRILADGRLAWLGDTFSRLPLAAQTNLRSYLTAALDRDPDAAASHLLAEMTASGAPGAEDRLRLHLRQAVPFRDGAWSASGRSLAEELFLHWRFARRCGFRPKAHLLAFFRGLAATESICRAVAPEADAMGDAVAELRLAAPWRRLGVLADVPRMREQLEAWTAVMAELPQKLDAALTAAAAAQREPPTPPRSARSSGATLAALLLGLGAVALVVVRLAEGAWEERLAAAMFLVLGVLLLRWLGRT